MPSFRQMSATVKPLARSRSASRSNRATSSALRRFLRSPSWTQSTKGLPFQVDQFLGSRPEEFLEFLRAAAASGPGGPTPPPIEAFLATHPAARRFAEAPKPIPASFARQAY